MKNTLKRLKSILSDHEEDEVAQVLELLVDLETEAYKKGFIDGRLAIGNE